MQLLGWDTIPAIVRTLKDEQAAAVMLTENLARQDLSPIDEANAYHKRMTEFNWTVEDISSKVGVSTVRVLFRLKLLKLRPDLQNLVKSSQLGLGYAQILADGELEPNRQLLSVSRLRENPTPTPGWFRSVINDLVTEQNQETLFPTEIFTKPVEKTHVPLPEPPHPSTTIPPKVGMDLPHIIKHQIEFWSQAAEEWSKLGRPFKKQECQIAARALELVLT